MSDDGNDDSSCDVVSVVECIVAPVGLASHGGIINFSGVNIASSDCVGATQHERCLSPLNAKLFNLLGTNFEASFTQALGFLSSTKETFFEDFRHVIL